MRQNVHVDLGARAYDVEIGPGLIATAGARIAPLLARPRVAVLTDETVAGLHLDALRAGDGTAAAKALRGHVAVQGARFNDLMATWRQSQPAGATARQLS